MRAKSIPGVYWCSRSNSLYRIRTLVVPFASNAAAVVLGDDTVGALKVINSIKFTRSLVLGMTIATAASVADAQVQPTTQEPEPVAVRVPVPVVQEAAPTAVTPVVAPVLSVGVARMHPALARACRDESAFDILGFVGAGVLMTAGITSLVIGLGEPSATRGVASTFALGAGPALILGGLAAPITRGLIARPDAFSEACSQAMRPQATAMDIEFAARAARSYARPWRPWLLLAILAGGTGLVISGVILGNTNQIDAIRVIGGLSGALITGLFLVPPTRRTLVAQRFVQEFTATPLIAPLLGPQLGITVGFGGQF